MAYVPVTHLVLAPAADVTDTDEWFGRLDAAVGLSGDARWRGETSGLEADLPRDEAHTVLQRARSALGDSLIASEQDGDEAQVLVADAATGRRLDD